jgi:hypothetical protein|tara:strand:- start:5470 stop:5820 length:351 start_codon:yes stop_codon:yes gene_type:complete
MQGLFWKLVRRYLDRSKNDIRSSEILIELPYPALIKTSILHEQALSSLIKEVREKCGEIGYEIDSVVFTQYFDGPIIFNQKHIKASSDDLLTIYRKKDGGCFAVVFSGSWVETPED